MTKSLNSTVSVAVGVVINSEQQIFITKRPDHVHQGGLWEFPGGKQELGESRVQALARELFEEIGVVVQQAQPLIQVVHDYGDKKVKLDVWQVTEFSGVAHGKEGQEGAWVPIARLADYAFPAADDVILTAIQLPDVYAISGQNLSCIADQVKSALLTGIRLFQLRVKGSFEQIQKVSELIIPLIHAETGKCLLSRNIEWVEPLGFDGVHLSSEQVTFLQERPLAKGFLVAGSCHNQRELECAQRLGVDFVVLSPVQKTASHPGAEPMGWSQFAAFCETTVLPVYALGGLQREDVDRVRDLGGRGVAAIRGAGF
ncbi:MAG: Nudix family hydrolase [Methylococcales bacterium]|jgi:8-oxo-dGTP diphosphatase|nr:Nudix family hydrolase [Methylococcales bacterium]MBT7446080.1 Nudix family hydrolase [Methylococcales bacterium]